MKKSLLSLVFFLLLFTGCRKEAPADNLAMKCQKAMDLEFYNNTHVIGVYNTEDGEVTKVEFVENFIPKWEDVDTDKLYKELDNKKASLQKKYESVAFTIDTYKNNVTSNYSILLTKKNLSQMKKEDAYKNAIHGDLFSVADYWVYLEENGYVCE